MYIRQTKTNNKITGEGYFTYRLVRGERVGGRVRQVTLINLGKHFPIKQEDWPVLCSRMEQLMSAQEVLAPIVCSDQIERAAQRYVGQLIAHRPGEDKGDMTAVDLATDTAGNNPITLPACDYQEVDIHSLALSQPRSVGVEHVALHALSQLGLMEKLAELGINGVVRSAMVGNVIGRMTQPASELATMNWLQAQSALGELIDVDFNSMSHMALYRASDTLMSHRQAIEDHVFSMTKTLFGFEESITLFDLTNTYFEGDVPGNAKAKHGRSKEKRRDRPLVTLGLVLDGSGFVRSSKTFAGNVVEGTTLADMLTGLGARPGNLVVMDAGIASEANLVWLVEHGYRYLVVRRGGVRQFDDNAAIAIETASGETVRLQKEVSEDGKEVLLYCHSIAREAKETAMTSLFAQRFEAGLQKIADGLSKPRSEKGHQKLSERIGRLKEKSRGAGQHYTITMTTNEKGDIVTALTWEKNQKSGTKAAHPGVYCLRSNVMEWDEQQLWRTYSMLTDLESVFRSLKSELGLRPIFHSKENRADGHLFITVLAYQGVQVLRRQLKDLGINDSWATLRKALSIQQRVTTSVRRKDGRTIHVRKCTTAEPALMKIYNAIHIHSLPGGTKKLIA